MTIDLTQIILAVISLIGAVLTGFVIPLLRQRLTQEKQIMLDSLIRTAVFGAEQIFKGTGLGEQKKAYVKELLRQHGYDADLEIINAAIEAAVKDLHIVEE